MTRGDDWQANDILRYTNADSFKKNEQAIVFTATLCIQLEGAKIWIYKTHI
jgi:hypothetical protein